MTINEKIGEKRTNYHRALLQFLEVLAAYKANRGGIVYQAALVHMFEIVSELAWKTLREILRKEGVEDIDTPRAVLKQAYTSRFISDGDAWMRALEDRNKTSHIYNEEVAQAILSAIERDYDTLFSALAKSLDAYDIRSQ